MKKFSLLIFCGIIFSFTNNIIANPIDASTHQRLVQEGQKQLCKLFDINDEAIENGRIQDMQFVVMLPDNEVPINYDLSHVTQGHTISSAAQSPEADTLNARIRRIYQQYGVELYLIYINSLDIIIHSEIPENVNYQQLFTQKLYDDATNMSALRQEHEQLSQDIINNTISPRQRDCIILSSGDYCGTFSHTGGKESHWQFCKEFVHHSTTPTFNELSSLYSDYGVRLMNDNNFRHGGTNVSAEGAVDEFAKAAKFAKLRAHLLELYTPVDGRSVLEEFNYPEDFTGMTIEQRRHVISVFAGFPMGQSSLLWQGEQDLVIKIINSTPKAQVNGVVYFLSQPSYLHGNPSYLGSAGSAAVITMVIRNTTDAFLTVGEDNYKNLITALTKMITSSEEDFNSHLPTTNEGWHNRQIPWAATNIGLCPKIGTLNYSVALQDNGVVEVTRSIVSAWNRSHFNAQSGEWTYTAQWSVDTAFDLSPFDIVFFKNESNVGMIEAAGPGHGQVSVVPAIFLKYAEDKSFNESALATVALTLDVVALATGPGAIMGAIDIGNMATAAFEAFQFTGAIGNLVANGINDPDLQSIVDKYNMIVGIWGFSHLATSIGKFSVSYFTEVKVGEVKAIPEGVASDFEAKYATAESKLSQLPQAEQEQIEKMNEYFKEEGVSSLSIADLLTQREAWLTNLKNQYGTLDFVGFTPEGLNNSQIPVSIYNEMINGYSNSLPQQMKESFCSNLVKSGSDIPVKHSIQTGGELFKIVPKGGAPGQSAFYMTSLELESIENSPLLEQKLGLPLGSHSAQYDVYKAVANEPVDVFESTVAPTNQRGYSTIGGAKQTFILNTEKWTITMEKTITPNR